MENQMTLAEIEQLISPNDWYKRLQGFQACIGRNDVPLEWLEKGVNDEDRSIRCSVFKACAGRSDIPLEWLEMGINEWDWRLRYYAFQACIGRTDVPLEWLGKGLNDGDCGVRYCAFEACIGRSDVPLEWLERGMGDENCDVRYCAFEACIGRNDVPLEWLEKGFGDTISYIRTTASKVLFDMGYQFPLIRTIEPADKVYKKCKNDVIVVAEIPKTAQVRGCIGEKCRTSEAVIVEIITGWNGCVEAVSWWDKKTTYKVGDRIVIDNFDHSNAECSTGFHFFNTLEEAKNYSI